MGQRLAAASLILVEAVVLGAFSRSLAFPLGVGAAAVVGTLIPRRRIVSARELFYLQVGIGVLMYVKYQLLPHEFEWTRDMIGSAAAYAVGQAALVYQLVPLYFSIQRQAGRPSRRRAIEAVSSSTIAPAGIGLRGTSDDRLPLWLPLLGVVALICFADIRVTRWERLVFQALSIAFAICCAVYCGSHRRFIGQLSPARRILRGMVSASTLVAAGVLTWIAASALYRYEQRIDEWLLRLSRPFWEHRVVGFSGTSRLGSLVFWKSADEDRIVLRIESDRAPGYLRAKAFDRLEGVEWRATAASGLAQSVDETLSNDELRLVALTDAVDWNGCRRLVCWPDKALAGRFFVPLGTVGVGTAEPDVFVDGHGIFRAQGDYPGMPYAAFLHDAFLRQPPGPQLRPLLMQVPPGLDMRVYRLARQVTAGCRTTREKIEAVERYFRRNYRYALGIPVPVGADPLTYFLLERPAAHCEYFASGATLLLRLAGVPCRYVTGFVAVEKNEFGGFWVARNRDAHAWAEAYDEARGWVIVEATPAEGVPGGTASSRARHFFEFLRAAFQRFRFRLQRDGVWPAAEWLAATVSNLSLWLALLAVAVVAGIAAALRRNRRSAGPVDPVLAEFHRILAQADARAARWNLHRGPGETLHQFARRLQSGPDAIRSLADWYRLYATLRYRDPLTPEALTRLKTIPREQTGPRSPSD